MFTLLIRLLAPLFSTFGIGQHVPVPAPAIVAQVPHKAAQSPHKAPKPVQAPVIHVAPKKAPTAPQVVPEAKTTPTTTLNPGGVVLKPCTDLSFTDSYGGAAGLGYYHFIVTNHGSNCVLSGYFGVTVNGTPGTVREPTSLSGQGPRSIVLATGKTASFDVSVIENSTSTCPAITTWSLSYDGHTWSVPQPAPQGGYCGGMHIFPIELGA